MSKLPQILGIIGTMMDSVEINQEKWKQEIRDEWEKSKNYPRKKKKQVRKRLLIDWSFACWSPFDDMYIK